MKEYLHSKEQVLQEMKTPATGLSAVEASSRLSVHGPNKLIGGKTVTLLQRFLAQLSDPMTIILMAAAVISGITAFYSGESFADVIIILVVVIINAVLGVVQESKAEQAIAALQEIAHSRRTADHHPQRRTRAGRSYRPGSRRCRPCGRAHYRMRQPEG